MNITRKFQPGTCSDVTSTGRVMERCTKDALPGDTLCKGHRDFRSALTALRVRRAQRMMNQRLAGVK